MAKEIRTMRVSKTTEAEINKMQQFFNEIEWYVKEHLSIEDIDFEQYEVFKTFGKLNDESNEQDYRDFIHNLLTYADDLGAFRLLCNTTTMLANCADPNCDVLEFNPEIKAALELAEEMKDIEPITSGELKLASSIMLKQLEAEQMQFEIHSEHLDGDEKKEHEISQQTLRLIANKLESRTTVFEKKPAIIETTNEVIEKEQTIEIDIELAESFLKEKGIEIDGYLGAAVPVLLKEFAESLTTNH